MAPQLSQKIPSVDPIDNYTFEHLKRFRFLAVVNVKEGEHNACYVIILVIIKLV